MRALHGISDKAEVMAKQKQESMVVNRAKCIWPLLLMRSVIINISKCTMWKILY